MDVTMVTKWNDERIVVVFVRFRYFIVRVSDDDEKTMCIEDIIYTVNAQRTIRVFWNSMDSMILHTLVVGGKRAPWQWRIVRTPPLVFR